MTEHEDPTAEFLAGVRAEETPWRVDRVEHLPPEPIVPEPTKWRRARAAAEAAGKAAPYLGTAATAGWLLTEDDPDCQLDGTSGI